MKKRLVLVPNNMGSAGAKALADTLSEKLGYKVWRVKPGQERGRPAFKLNPGTPKDEQFDAFARHDVPTVEHTRDREQAAQWIADGDTVMCRTLLRSSEGKGIVVANTVEELVPAPLYTRYLKKKAEFRVHVFNGEVIDVQQKRKRSEHNGDRDVRIRNLANGYVFCRDGIEEPAGLRDAAIQATAALGYSIGAVDIVHNHHHNRLAVLEVNANPGMQGTTLEKYADAIVKGLQ